MSLSRPSPHRPGARMGGLPRRECRIITTKSSRGVSGLYRTAAQTGPISPQEQVWDNEGGAPVASNRKPTISIS
jgi:hypothetical protein